MLESRGGFRPSPFALPIDIGKSSEIFVEITIFTTNTVYSSGKVNNADPVLPADLLQSAPFDRGIITNARADNGPLMRVYVRQLASPTGPAGYLVVGQSLAGIEGELAGLRLFLAAGGLLTRLAALNDIAGESERMSRMVQDLLTLARADAGYHLDKAPIDLLPIMQEVTRQAQTLQPQRRIELLDGLPLPVQGNADAIKQLLWILIDNAFKHTHEGGRIQLRLDNGHQVARLMVADDGPGIPAEDLERVFERFYQSDAARSGEGTGLGLAIARWIAKEHGGQVTAANNPRGGAAFTVELPVQKS